MLKKAVMCAATGLALALAWMTPALAADSTPPTHHTVHLTIRGTASLSWGKLQRHDAPATAVQPFDNPPGGGCSAPIAGQITGDYTNGTLTTMLATYQSQVICTATGSGQSMGALVTTAELWESSNQIQSGPTVNCVNFLMSPQSEDIYACAGVVCAGTYWAANVYFLSAPAG